MSTPSHVAFPQTAKQQYMFQYFLKVVSTQFNMLDRRVVRSQFLRLS